MCFETVENEVSFAYFFEIKIYFFYKCMIDIFSRKCLREYMGEYDSDFFLFSTNEYHALDFCIYIIRMMKYPTTIGVKGVNSIAEIPCLLWIGTIFCTAWILEGLLGIVHEFVEKTSFDRIESSSTSDNSCTVIYRDKSR